MAHRIARIEFPSRRLPHVSNKFWLRTLFCQMRAMLQASISLVLMACVAWAAGAPAPLHLDPGSVVIGILDREGELSTQAFQRLFRSAGFEVAVVDNCEVRANQACLRNSLVEVRNRFSSRKIVLFASSSHSGDVYSLYESKQTGALLSGIILLRSNHPFRIPASENARNGPPFLMIVKETDDQETVIASREFADHMRRSGIRTWYVTVSGRPLTAAGSSMTKIILFFIGALKQQDPLYDRLAGTALWQNRPINNAAFYNLSEFIASYPVDDLFMADINAFFRFNTEKMKPWKFERFEGFDPLQYRDAHSTTRGMRYLVLRNHTGQLSVIDLSLYAQYAPVIVIGIDDEKNMFRLAQYYLSRRTYSWLDDNPPAGLSVEPLGAFLHFRKPLPEQKGMPLSPRSKLSLSSITFSDVDPLVRLSTLPKSVRKPVMTNCISCHSLDGVGGRAIHLAAATAKPQPWSALPLRQYPKDVLHRFLFDQDRVAESFGVVPNRLPQDEAAALFRFLTERK